MESYIYLAISKVLRLAATPVNPFQPEPGLPIGPRFSLSNLARHVIALR